MPLEMQGRSSDGYAMHWLSLGLYHALAMLWATFWALVLGFTISGPGFCRQGTDQPRVCPNEFEIGLVRDRFGCGEQFLFVCGGCGGAECDAARRGTHPSSGVYVRLNQFGDRARGGALGFDGVAVCVRGSLGRPNAYPNHVVIDTLVFT